LHRRQPAEKSPGQTGVIGQGDALSLGHHEGYIAVRTGSDNASGRSVDDLKFKLGGAR
jgi:hypothetical protein